MLWPLSLWKALVLLSLEMGMQHLTSSKRFCQRRASCCLHENLFKLHQITDLKNCCLCVDFSSCIPQGLCLHCSSTSWEVCRNSSCNCSPCFLWDGLDLCAGIWCEEKEGSLLCSKANFSFCYGQWICTNQLLFLGRRVITLLFFSEPRNIFHFLLQFS